LTCGESILVSAGEVSGDHYIAMVAPFLRNGGFGGRIYGLCGEEARACGVEALWDNGRLHVMGFSEVAGALADILRLMREVYREVIMARPKAMVVVDSPDFHLPLIRRLRRGGYHGKIFYISPPSVWAWRSYRVKTLSSCVDLCLPLFKHEHDYLSLHGCKSLWKGHPLVEELSVPVLDVDAVVGGIRGKVDRDGIVALLPGSRRSEIEALYPLLSRAYDIISERGYSPVFSVAPGLSEAARASLVPRLESEGRVYYGGSGRDLMSVSRAAAGSSGTATAEALLLRRYMVVMYKLRPLSALIGKLLLSHLRFAIPNILAGEEFFPELIQSRATGEAAAAAVLEWLESDAIAREERESRMEELAGLMGETGIYGLWSDAITGAVS
jgi:lipid-A-disaccharide synthase